MHCKIVLILGLVIFVADGGSVLAQPGGRGPGGAGAGGGQFPGGGGPGGGGRGGKGGRGGMDPSRLFDRFANGKDVISRADIDPNNQWVLGMFDQVAQALNITNGQITRDQFVTGFEQVRQNFGRGGPGGPAGGNQGPGGAGPGQSFDDMAAAQFKQLDKNNDGYLNTDEMPPGLRAQLARWDTNRDNLIDLQEFKAYLRDQSPQGLNQPAFYELANIPDPEEEKRPVVYNSKNYPRELPAWFKQLDLDGDGQIGLYEWRRAGKPIEEFMAMDRNEDGFLTVEEVLYAVARKSTKGSDVQMASFSPGNGATMSNPDPSANGLPNANGFPNGGGPRGFGPGKGFNKGQFGNGQFRGPGGTGGGDQAQIGGRRGRGGFGPGGGDNGNGDSRGKKGGGRRGGNGPGGGGNGN